MDISTGIGIMLTTITLNSTLEKSPDRDRYESATRTVMEVVYKQSGMDHELSKLEKKLVHPKVREYGGWTIAITRAIVEQKVGFRWEF